jgi:hypothetical protein
MSTAINNSRWAAAFAEELQAEDELDEAQSIPYQFLPPSQIEGAQESLAR